MAGLGTSNKGITQEFLYLIAFSNKPQTIMSQPRPQAPKQSTVIISLVIVLLGLFGAAISPAIADNGDWFLLGGFVLLLLGVYVKGL